MSLFGDGDNLSQKLLVTGLVGIRHKSTSFSSMIAIIEKIPKDFYKKRNGFLNKGYICAMISVKRRDPYDAAG